MSHTTKSLKDAALAALAVARGALPPYAHRFSPRKFTQHQLFACLVLKEYFHTDYRGIAQSLADLPSLRELLGLKAVPHFTTLQKAAQRLLRQGPANRLLTQSVEQCLRSQGPDYSVQLAALDSSGLEACRISHYFVQRRKEGLRGPLATRFKSYPKLTVLCDCQTHVILAAVPDRAPRQEIWCLEPAVRQALARRGIQTLLADAAYDAEWVHRMLRDQFGLWAIIPAQRGPPTGKPAAGQYRRLMQQTIHLTPYGQRWQVETVMSMIKRRLGSALGACSYWAQRRAMMLKAIAHNVLILLRRHRFSTEHQNRYSCPLEVANNANRSLERFDVVKLTPRVKFIDENQVHPSDL